MNHLNRFTVEGEGARVTMEEAERVFRLDNEVLSFRFTATVSHRAGSAPLDRLAPPARLGLWLEATGLAPGRATGAVDARDAVELREAIYRLGAATARGRRRNAPDLAVLHAAATAGHLAPMLTDAGRRWTLRPQHPVADALAVIAHDAIAVLGTAPAGRVKTCAGEDCAGLFLDTSRGGSRRWCSMNTCGNRAKKSRMTPSAPARRLSANEAPTPRARA